MADGGTVLCGRRSGIQKKQKLLGIPIEPEKEVVLTVTYSDRIDHMLDEIRRVPDLCKPGMGIAFAVPIQKVVGVAHGVCAIP